MAYHINKISVQTPTNFVGTPSVGGNLSLNTTYFYRIAAVRHYDNKFIVVSAWSNEISASTDTTNLTINLDWDTILFN